MFPRFSLFAQNSNSWRGDALTLKLAVMGPGDELYFWFGHIGLVVENKVSGQARYFDWGVFSFENNHFFVDFAFGRLIYSCMVSRPEPNYNAYAQHNRSITLYTLDLPPEKKEEVLRFAENNVLPENRDYHYHFFKDNCATRIRDILDMALDGQFSAEFAQAPGRFTLRQHVRRHTWFNPFFDWILNFWMGQDIDRPITIWDEMFLPSEIALRINDFRYTENGTERDLVSSVEVLNRSQGRPVVLDVPRRQWPRELLASVLFSALLLVIYFLKGSHKRFRISIALVQSALGVFFGVAGTMLFFMSFFTDHDYTYHNSNILFVNPLFFAAVPLGIIYAFTKNQKKRFIAIRLLRVFWTYVLLGGFLTMLIKLSPNFFQQNQVDLALILPVALTMLFITARLGRFTKQ